MKAIYLIITVCVLGFASLYIWSSPWSQNHGHNGDATPYAGLQSRPIKSLSEQDIEEIQKGHGWGLALPAELNGLPGPKHLLELKKPLKLSTTQIDQITDIYRAMKEDAIITGERFIAAEAALSSAFENQNLEKYQLNELLSEAATARADLRFVHLSRHIETTKLLTTDQIKQYAVLRGYTDNPCVNVPEGHDPEMWRKHNGCS